MTKRDYLETTLRREMDTSGVDAVVAISPESFQHLSGAFIPSQRMIPDRLAFAVYPRSGAPFLVVSTIVEHDARTQSWIDDVSTYAEFAVLPIHGLIQALRKRDLGTGRIWIELGYLPARDAYLLRGELPGLEILDAEDVLGRSRMIKLPDEIEHLGRIARIWEEAVLAGYESVRDGDTEQAVARRMIFNLLERGADWVPFHTFASGPERTLIPHAVPTEVSMQRGDIMRMDMVGFFRGYYTDFARMAIIGSPSTSQREAYRKIVTLQRETILRAKPGLLARDLHEEIVAVGKDLGLGVTTPAVGHGIGLGLHEHPVLSPFEEQVLANDMILCVEINSVFPGLGHFGVEDLIQVTERGGERLTTLINTDEMLVVGE